jgi:hypothetical protein
MFTFVATTAFIAAMVLSPALAQSPSVESTKSFVLAQRSSATPIKDAKRNSTLAAAASITEDLIDFALAGKPDAVVEKVGAMRKTFPTLRPMLSESDAATLERRVIEMEQASAKGDITGTALAAVEAYRTIESAMDVARTPVPIEVAMMDYSGFKLSILAGAQTTDWPAIAATTMEADSFLIALAKKIQDTSIRNLVSAIQSGLKVAVERKEINGVKFAAKMQLEVVDVLEQYFKGAYRNSVR